jgi:hypothetical protein
LKQGVMMEMVFKVVGEDFAMSGTV